MCPLLAGSALAGDSYKKLPVVRPHSFLNRLETVNMVGVCMLVEKLRGVNISAELLNDTE